MDSAAGLVQQSESASHSSGNSDSKIMESSSTNEEGNLIVESMDPKTAEKGPAIPVTNQSPASQLSGMCAVHIHNTLL